MPAAAKLNIKCELREIAERFKRKVLASMQVLLGRNWGTEASLNKRRNCWLPARDSFEIVLVGNMRITLKTNIDSSSEYYLFLRREGSGKDAGVPMLLLQSGRGCPVANVRYWCVAAAQGDSGHCG